MLQQKMKYLTIAFHVYFSVNLGFRVKKLSVFKVNFRSPLSNFLDLLAFKQVQIISASARVFLRPGESMGP